MFRQFDSVTVALTGQLFFILLVSAVLALTASYLLLRLYRRAVIKSMRRVGSNEIIEPKGYLPPEPEHKPHDAPLNFNFLARRALKANREAISLYRRAIRRRWLAAFVYVIAGCIFEISELFNLVPFQRLVFIVDEALIRNLCVRRCWRHGKD